MISIEKPEKEEEIKPKETIEAREKRLQALGYESPSEEERAHNLEMNLMQFFLER